MSEITMHGMYVLTMVAVCEALHKPGHSMEQLVASWKPINAPNTFEFDEATRIRKAFWPNLELAVRLYAENSEVALAASSGILMGLLLESMLQCSFNTISE